MHAYVTALPNPFPMFEASTNLTVVRGQVMAFCHPDQPTPDSGRVWVAWAQAGTGDAVVELPTQQERVEVITANGDSKTMTTIIGRIRIQLNGDNKMADPVLIIDRSAKAEH